MDYSIFSNITYPRTIPHTGPGISIFHADIDNPYYSQSTGSAPQTNLNLFPPCSYILYFACGHVFRGIDSISDFFERTTTNEKDEIKCPTCNKPLERVTIRKTMSEKQKIFRGIYKLLHTP